MRLGSFTIVSAMALTLSYSVIADAACDGPFVTQKYPIPHAVFVDTQTRCYSKWVVTESSPEDVRCLFTYVDHKPTTRPDVQITLTQNAYDSLIATATTQGQSNTSGNLGDRYVFIGFRSDLTPTDGTPGCP